MKNILFVANEDSGQEARLQCALDVVRAVGGHLNCLGVVTPLAVLGDFDSGQAQQVVMDAAIAADRANRARIEPRLVAEGVPFSWVDAVGGLVETIRVQAGLNDLIVVGSHGQWGESERLDIAARIVKPAGRPVLAVPHQARSLDLFGSAIVAWDGSGPADAALRAAIPLLRFARRVVLVAIGDGHAPDGLEDAASYSSRQGLSVETQRVPVDQDGICRSILHCAQESGAAWIVMGAYGHAKLREDLFGGVTRAMIEHSEIPLFLAH